MLEKNEISQIKEEVEMFFQKMTIRVSHLDFHHSMVGEKEVLNIDATIDDPQILIGQQGQTLFELARLLRVLLNKKLQKYFYINLDIFF